MSRGVRRTGWAPRGRWNFAVLPGGAVRWRGWREMGSDGGHVYPMCTGHPQPRRRRQPHQYAHPDPRPRRAGYRMTASDWRGWQPVRAGPSPGAPRHRTGRPKPCGPEEPPANVTGRSKRPGGHYGAPMSYDILAFDPAAVADADFTAWWEEQSQWSEDHSYDDPVVTTANLRSFYNELIQTFPPMNYSTSRAWLLIRWNARRHHSRPF